MLEVSARTFRYLLVMADSEYMGAVAEVIADKAGDETPALTAAGLLVPGPNLDSVKAWPGDDEYRPILETDEVNRTVTCFHPDVGFVTVSDECLRTWRLDPDKLVELIGCQLGLPASFRPTALASGLLWSLGTPRLGRNNVPVLFARTLGNEATRLRIRSELELLAGNKLSVLLTPAHRVQADLTLPMVSKVVPIAEVLDRTSDIARLDTERLAAIAGLSRLITARPELPVECEENGHWIRISGNSYNFRDKQAKVIRLLYEAWVSGQDWSREQEVLEMADSISTQIRRLFKGRADWQRIIEVQGGYCRLRVNEGSICPG
ncbi:MAG: hypothetical protein WCF85_18890 [Rhodospirillaceae bacterium]